MGKKIAGKLNDPPAQADFDKLALAGLCCQRAGVFYRLHSIEPATGDPWPPVHFSRRENSRFDPEGGVGVMCVAETFAGALMELFDDHWGPVGSLGRSVTEQQLRETWVTRISIPAVNLFDATAGNLSKIGTDAQLLSGDYTTTRKWAARMMDHPDRIGGIVYRSRHDPGRINVALFERGVPLAIDPDLRPFEPDAWRRQTGRHGGAVVYGPAIVLRDHPGIMPALMELQVARLP